LPVPQSTTARPRPRPPTADLPSGLAAIIGELLQAGGASVAFSVPGRAVSGAARRWLATLPASGTFQREQVPTEVSGVSTEPWIVRRREFLDAIGGDSAARFLVRAPQVLLAESGVLAVAEALNNAAAELYRAAQTLPDEGVHAILNLETVILRDEGGAL